MTRPVAIVSTACLAVCVALPACSETTRHRVLSFFLDGVPPPGTPPPPKRRGASTPRLTVQAPQAPAESIVGRVRMFPHAPYRDNRCGGCHDLESGGLVQPLERGLCASCHPTTPGDAAYVHGPVAVNACVQCHHYHASPYPKLLVLDPVATCLQCHDRQDLSEEPHHPKEPEARSCVECHDPHGGDDRFFLKRSDG